MREQGWSPQLLISLQQTGQLQRLARGLYGLPDAEVTEHQAVIEVCQRVRKAVLCLLSALQFHGIGTQQPREVWVALPEATQTPRLDYPSLRVVRLRGAAYGEGIQTVVEHGASLRVYGAAKTVTDCFKFRHKIGLDVALEALKDAWRSGKVTMPELGHFAKISRHADRFLLKGALLFAFWYDAPHRPTRDIDFLGFGPDDAENLIAVFRDAVSSDMQDGIVLDPDSVKAEPIREADAYGGMRVTLSARIGDTVALLHDLLWPPTEVAVAGNQATAIWRPETLRWV